MKHETRNTLEITKWCNTCRRMTQHRVSDRRVGTCLEHGARGADAEGRSRRQIEEAKRREKEEREPKLF